MAVKPIEKVKLLFCLRCSGFRSCDRNLTRIYQFKEDLGNQRVVLSW